MSSMKKKTVTTSKGVAKKILKKSARLKSPVKKKKAVKKAAKKTLSRKAAFASPVTGKPIGNVTHFFTEISVAIVVFKQNVPAGTMLHFRGATTDFKQPAKSMQFDHAPVAVAKKGKQIGIKVKNRVREGDAVHKG